MFLKKPRGFEKYYSNEDGDKRDEEKKSEDKDKKGGKPDNEIDITQAAVATAALALLTTYYLSQQSPPDTITWQELYGELMMKGFIERVEIINKEIARIHIRHDATGDHAGKVYKMEIGSMEFFENRLEAAQSGMGLRPQDFIPVKYVTEVRWEEELIRFLPSLISLVFIFILLRSAGGMIRGDGGAGLGGGKGGRNMFNMNKAFPAGSKDLKSKVRFTDVAGMGQAKMEVTEFVDFLKNPKFYEKVGAKIPKGGLLVGPPGTGKTLLAKAVAGEADRPFFSMSGSDFLEMFVGVGPARVRDLFKQAREAAPSIVFIDEIDAVGRKRGKGGFAGNSEHENTLNALLVEMDGFVDHQGVVVLAGTNRLDILDPALTRPGRFDRTISVDKPDLNEREEIFMVHLRPIKLDPEVDRGQLARRMASLTPGFAGAEIANICNEAAIVCARRKGTGTTFEDFEKATDRVIAGLPKLNSPMTEEQRKTVALHESGHAVVGWFLEHSDPLLKVTIVPRSSGALGFAQYLPKEMQLQSKEMLLDKICGLLGGRVAEELFVGKITNGASDDLNKVTKIAYGMIQVFGMSDKSLLSFQNDNQQEFFKPYSEQTAQEMDRLANEIVDQQYERAKVLLKEHQEKLKTLAAQLLEKETMDLTSITEVLGPRPFNPEGFGKFLEIRQKPLTKEEKDSEVLDENSGVAAAA